MKVGDLVRIKASNELFTQLLADWGMPRNFEVGVIIEKIDSPAPWRVMHEDGSMCLCFDHEIEVINEEK